MPSIWKPFHLRPEFPARKEAEAAWRRRTAQRRGYRRSTRSVGPTLPSILSTARGGIGIGVPPNFLAPPRPLAGRRLFDPVPRTNPLGPPQSTPCQPGKSTLLFTIFSGYTRPGSTFPLPPLATSKRREKWRFCVYSGPIVYYHALRGVICLISALTGIDRLD